MISFKSMTKRNKIIKHLQRYKDIYTLCVSIIAAVSTLICSLISIGVLRNQITMQKNLNQPIFSVYTTIDCDKENEDDFKGTEYLFVENNGQKYISSHVEETVFFSLEKNFKGTRTKVIVEIPDYFFVGYTNSSQQSSIVYKGEGIGSNRLYNKLYNEAINDLENEFTLYSIEKIFLVRVAYTDIYNEEHVKYYKDNQEINKDEYKSIFALSKSNNKTVYRVDLITYQTMKELLRQQEQSKKN